MAEQAAITKTRKRKTTAPKPTLPPTGGKTAAPGVPSEVRLKKRSIYWNERYESVVKTVYQQMKKAGIPCDYGGEMSVSAVILYALEQQARSGGKRE